MATTVLGAGEVYDVHLASLASVQRSKMEQRTNALFPIRPSDWRVWDAPAKPLPGDGQVEEGVTAVSFAWNPASVDSPAFVASRAYRVLGITARVEVAGTDGGAVSAVVKKAASATALGSGTALHTGSIDLKGSAATNQTLSLSGTSSTLDIPSGTCIAVDFTGTLTSAVGVVTVLLQPAASPDDLRLVTGTFGSAPCYVGTKDLKAAGATTCYARAFVPIPPDFEGNSQTVTLRAYAGMVTSVADTSATVAFSAYRVKRDGTLDSTGNLVTTSAQSINSLTAAAKDFDLTNANLVAGDSLDVRVAVAVNDAATVTAVIAALWDVLLLADLR